jgi:hypothetical protein
MWLPAWLVGDSFCKREFKPLWCDFIDAVADAAIAGGPTVKPPRQCSERPHTLQSFYPAPSRLVAFGDVHGDLNQIKKAFKAAGIIDHDFRWSGGQTVAVQACIFATILSPH